MSGTFDSPRLRNLKPYTPGEQSGGERLVKLNANENPYPPSPLAVAAMMEAVKSGLELYLDPNAGLVRENVASYYGLRMTTIVYSYVRLSIDRCTATDFG